MSTDAHEKQSVEGHAPRAAQTGEQPALRPEGVEAEAETIWTIQDVSSYLRIPVSSIYKMTARKATVRIPYIRIGAALRFRKSAIDQWLSLLTVSNLEALTKIRQRVGKVKHGNDP